jgi:hypothetical protein
MILVYRDRVGEAYATSLVFHRRDSITLAAFSDISFSVDDLLGSE